LIADRNESHVFSCPTVSLLLLLLAPCAALAAQSPVAYGVSETKDVMIPMRDGVRLAADIYRPTQNGEVLEFRVDISSSNFPRFDINPNTGEPLNDNRRTQIAHNTIYLDDKRPSRIILPIIPEKTGGAAIPK
jgi:predicted acyl esterase